VRAAGSSVPGTETDEVDLLDRVAIQRRFSGPATAANGGYVCGLLARFVGVAAQITLRRPPPLEREFSIVRFVDGRVAMTDGDLVIADAIRSAVHHVVPRPVGVADAVLAQRVPTAHPFPTCFVCGPERADGLRLFAGPVQGTDLVAAAWIPAADLAGPDGHVHPEFVWAALDCPGAFAVVDLGRQPVVLGRLEARQMSPITAGHTYVVLGWPLGHDGRKLLAGTAIYGRNGELFAAARATWFEA
jgi:hypothetical protein